MQNFRALGTPPPDPVPPAAGGSAPRTQKLAPLLRISGYALGSIIGEDLFFGVHLNSGKKGVLFLVKTFFLLFT